MVKKYDELRKNQNKKASKTINFDYDVLKQLEKTCDSIGTTVSHFLNNHMKTVLFSKKDYYAMMAKKACSEMNYWLDKKRQWEIDNEPVSPKDL